MAVSTCRFTSACIPANVIRLVQGHQDWEQTWQRYFSGDMMRRNDDEDWPAPSTAAAAAVTPRVLPPAGRSHRRRPWMRSVGLCRRSRWNLKQQRDVSQSKYSTGAAGADAGSRASSSRTQQHPCALSLLLLLLHRSGNGFHSSPLSIYALMDRDKRHKARATVADVMEYSIRWWMQLFKGQLFFTLRSSTLRTSTPSIRLESEAGFVPTSL